DAGAECQRVHDDRSAAADGRRLRRESRRRPRQCAAFRSRQYRGRWLGSDGGGVWKTTNCCTSSTTWTVKTDFAQLSTMAIDDITMDPNNHNVLYAATGDLNYGSFSFGSAGVLKSTDRGETWTVLGS